MVPMSQKMDTHKQGKYCYIISDTVAIEPNLDFIHINEFESSSKFDINKWIKNDNSFCHNINSMPFSYGRRDCMGSQFALKEMYLVLANLIINYKLTLDDPNVQLQFFQGISKHVRPEIPVCVEKR